MNKYLKTFEEIETQKFLDEFTDELFMNYYESVEIAKIAVNIFCKYFKEKEKTWYGKSDDLKYWESINKELNKL